jgi:hypothetical protein
VARAAAHRRRAAGVLALAALTTGCHSWEPVAAGALPPGTVRVTLAPGASTAATLGPNAAALDGRLVARTDSSVTLAVSEVARASGAEERWTGDAVTLPLSAVLRVERQRLARGRTAAVVVGSVLGIYLAGRAMGGFEASGGRLTGGPVNPR